MSANDFIKQLRKCRSVAAVERLLSGWFNLQASPAEFAALRAAVVEQMDGIEKGVGHEALGTGKNFLPNAHSLTPQA